MRLLRVRTFGDGHERRPPGSRENPAENRGRGGRARTQQVGEAVMFGSRRWVAQDAEEALAHGEVETDHQRGHHGRGAIHGGGCRYRALHPVEKAPLDVVPHEVVQPELAAEVVVEGARRDIRRCRQLADRDVVERTFPELLHSRERKPALRRG